MVIDTINHLIFYELTKRNCWIDFMASNIYGVTPYHAQLTVYQFQRKKKYNKSKMYLVFRPIQ